VWVLAPICPHTLSDRPIVVRAGSTISCACRSARNAGQVTCDGTALGDLEQGDELSSRARGSNHPAASAGIRLLPVAALEAALGPRRPRQRRLAAMLTHLQLRDLVIVDEAELEFGPGLLALTGETGAGKSIVVDALLLIAGGRGAGDIVRHGAERAEVAAGFARCPPARRLARCAGDRARRRGHRAARDRGGRPLARLYERSAGSGPVTARAGGIPDRNSWPAGIPALVKRGAQRELLDEHLAEIGSHRRREEIYERYRSCRRDYEALKSAAENRDARLDLLALSAGRAQGEVTTVSAIEELFTSKSASPAAAARGRGAEAALAAVYEDDGASAHDLLAKASDGLARRGRHRSGLAPARAAAGEAPSWPRGRRVAAALPGGSRRGSGAPGGDRAQRRGARVARAQAPPERDSSCPRSSRAPRK
jgi:hypothetical protein